MQPADHDSWDPSTGVGVTATFGAVARAVCTDKGLLKGDTPITTGLIDILAAHTPISANIVISQSS
ncbi:hypothetical protein [Mycobacterium sp. HUMS_1102779]|uniref:hypothetical protein n=1 Tax=Mycobacterium sp. HUMS_1102779 TaxID=3383487 RepID=UPI00389A39DA